MLKKLILLILMITVIFMVTDLSFSKTASYMKNHFGSVEQTTEQVGTWLENQQDEWTVDHFKQQLTNLFQIKEREKEQSDSGNVTEPQTSDSDTEVSSEVSAFEKEVVKLVNEERRTRGLEPLKIHKPLSKLAERKSQDMADHQYFSHTSPNYGSPFDMMRQFEFQFRSAGENIAAGQRSPAQVVEGWMNSDGHRANILHKSFTHIGVGYVEGGSYGTYWTQLFMTPM